MRSITSVTNALMTEKARFILKSLKLLIWFSH
jgi:hypothetical protein